MLNQELKEDYDRLIEVDYLIKRLLKTNKILTPAGKREYEKLKKEFYNLKTKLNKNGILIGDDQKWK